MNELELRLKIATAHRRVARGIRGSKRRLRRLQEEYRRSGFEVVRGGSAGLIRETELGVELHEARRQP
jgi:hypothetical protein